MTGIIALRMQNLNFRGYIKPLKIPQKSEFAESVMIMFNLNLMSLYWYKIRN